MSSSLLTFAVLFLQCWVATVHATEAVSTCCLRTTNTMVPPERIENYTRQSDAVCPIAAIMFRTKKGISICSNPQDPWAKKAMAKVDKDRDRRTRDLTAGGTRTGGPALTRRLRTEPKNGGRKRDRKGRGNRRGGKRRGGKRRNGQRSRVGTTVGA